MEPVPNNSSFSPEFTSDSPQEWFFDLDCLDEELPFPLSPTNYDLCPPQDYSFDQYGAGPSNISSPAPPPRRSVKSTRFPSDEELTYLRRYAQVAEDFNFKRLNLDVVKMPPQRLQFKNLDALPQGVSLNDHMAKVFDIFIRKMIQKGRREPIQYKILAKVRVKKLFKSRKQLLETPVKKIPISKTRATKPKNSEFLINQKKKLDVAVMKCCAGKLVWTFEEDRMILKMCNRCVDLNRGYARILD
ncbi:hypothetical protein GCK72_011152 [Caenorhabditis remanei]|uniref:Uncharacterized protein n=1 Tax=Caenorhabditis remanei TaxID=31234 RepID=A0A6A5H578_CAERE|nr:hypothetical protein GCK72_011152 [Caenorhabditis remanei]KAF1762888.1 hypothetical protein GCK72_011152 [Caenorhabditis remanei]